MVLVVYVVDSWTSRAAKFDPSIYLSVGLLVLHCVCGLVVGIVARLGSFLCSVFFVTQ